MLPAIFIAVAMVTLGDGSEWTCNSEARWGGVSYTCVDAKGGRLYQGGRPLSDASWAAYQAQQERDTEEALCVCSREIHGGTNSTVGNIICTGAFDPYLLRKREVDPCDGAWKKRE